MIALDALNAEQRDRAAEYGLAALAFFESKDNADPKVRAYFRAKSRLKEALGLDMLTAAQADGAPR